MTFEITEDLTYKIWKKAQVVAGVEINIVLKALKEVLEESPKQDFWIAYDNQTGKWCVEQKPFEVVRPGMEIIHVKEVSREEVPEIGQTVPVDFWNHPL